MWPELKEEVELELAMLREHLDAFADLRRVSLDREPNRVELMALAGMLHSFYSGVENILKRVAIHCDGGPPHRASWHQSLLENMSEPGPKRPSVLSKELRGRLKNYLDFRHFFRQAYSFQLNWAKMAPLVRDCDGVFSAFDGEIGAFLHAIRPTPK